jgi:hypothetical protein
MGVQEPQVPQKIGIRITTRMAMWQATTKLQTSELELNLQCQLSQQSDINFKNTLNVKQTISANPSK